MGGSSRRRVLSRSCFAAATVALVAGAFPARGVAQEPGPRPKIFSTTASAIAVDFFPDQEGGLTPIAETFHMQFVTGTSSMSSSNGPTARSSIAHPGNGITQGPANACPFVPGIQTSVVAGFNEGGGEAIGEPLQELFDQLNAELKPLYDTCTYTKWPFTSQADGFTPEASTVGALAFGEPGGALHGEGGGAHASIFEDGTSATDATISGLRIAPLPGGGATGLPVPPAIADVLTQLNGGAAPVDTAVFTVGSIESTTANLFEGTVAVSRTTSRLTGLRLLGGIVTIDSITSIAEARYAADADPVGTSSTVVEGVTVLGQAATIDDNGVHPTDDPSDESLNQALGSVGATLRLVGATQAFDDRGFMTARSDGVTFEFNRAVETGVTLPPPPPNPISATSPSLDGTYFVRYNFASVRSRAFARELSLGGGSVGGSTSLLPTGSAGAPLPAPSGTATPSGFTGGTLAAAPPAAPGAPTTEAGSPIGFTLNFDLRWLYLAFTLGTLGICIAPRWMLPARLPTTRAVR